MNIKSLARHRHFHSLLAVKIAFSITAIYSQTAKADFFEDASADLELRNFWMQRDYRNDPSGTQNKSQEWTQSFILDFKSGYTDTPVGFGVDVLGLFAVKLGGGAGTPGTQLLPTHSGNDPADDFGRLAIAGKMRYSKTEFKVGEWKIVNPILRGDDGRALTQTFQGMELQSKEVDNTTLYAGQIWQNSPRNDGSLEDMYITKDSSAKSDRFNYGGVEYKFNQGNTKVAAWFGQLQDIYKQRYFEVLHTQPITEGITFKTHINYFNGEEDGSAKAGKLDNKVISGKFSLQVNHHTFGFNLQRVTGDDAWLRVNGTSGGSMANDGFTASFDNARERSWQVNYAYDFAGLGVPGLTFFTRYNKGTNVHAGGKTDGEEWNRESQVAYLVQDGTFEDLYIRVRNSTMRRDWGTKTSHMDTRVIVTYPISLF